MWKNVKEWLSSKKAKALVVALVMLTVALAMGEIKALDFIKGGLGALAVYMGAQGLADFGTGGSAIMKKLGTLGEKNTDE